MNDAVESRRFWVQGRVQGVFFRASARERAVRLGLAGWAENLPDGRVEILACGAPDAMQSFARWLAEGPPRARVERVTSEVIEAPAAVGFEIR